MARSSQREKVKPAFLADLRAAMATSGSTVMPVSLVLVERACLGMVRGEAVVSGAGRR